MTAGGGGESAGHNEMTIEENMKEINARISRACERSGRSPDEVTMVAISKTQSPEAVHAAFRAGIRHFGENRVQEAGGKLPELKEIRDQSTWHMVGHLQTNKVKTALELFDIIQSVDSLKLAAFLSRNAHGNVPVFLQVNLAGEETKSGFSIEELAEAASRIEAMPNLKVDGLMTIAPLVDDPEEARPVFRQLRLLGQSLGLKQLSMGMTDDLEVAVEEGATIVRIGRAIFGERRTQ